MFKRVEKRRRKKEEEEDLGLDEGMKEILGMHDTDSEESASESDSDGSSGGEEDEEEEENNMEIEMDGEEGGSSGEDEEEEEEEKEEDPEVSVSQALNDPIYVVSILPEVKACIVCPGKLLKGVKMVQLHRTSNACTISLVYHTSLGLANRLLLCVFFVPQAHQRRVKQFKTFAVDADPSESAWEVLKRNAEEKPKLSLTPSGTGNSNRAEKRKTQQARQKLRREKIKEKRAKQAAKKALAAPASKEPATAPSTTGKTESSSSKPKEKGSTKSKTTSSPIKKKRKLEIPAEPKDTDNSAAAPPPSAMNPTHKSSKAEKSSPSKKKDKAKQKKPAAEAATAITSENDDSKDAAMPKRQQSVKSIVRSTSDRAKNARSRALTMSSGGKGKVPRKKSVEVS